MKGFWHRNPWSTRTQHMLPILVSCDFDYSSPFQDPAQCMKADMHKKVFCLLTTYYTKAFNNHSKGLSESHPKTQSLEASLVISCPILFLVQMERF